AIHFDYDEEIKSHLKKLQDVRWSQTHRCFYFPSSGENQNLLFVHLRSKGWFVDYSKLKREKMILPVYKSINLPFLIEENKRSILRFKKWMEQKRLSKNTVATYFDVTTNFLKYLQKKRADTIN